MKLSVIFAILVLASSTFTQANNRITATKTVITIEDFDCEACGEVVKYALQDVKGTGIIQLAFDNETATIVPQMNKVLSPKALWEAVEEVGFVPTKLVGPNGTFTKKPAS